jgi:hypothetical protein
MELEAMLQRGATGQENARFPSSFSIRDIEERRWVTEPDFAAGRPLRAGLLIRDN